jgi:hypothetical protein
MRNKLREEGEGSFYIDYKKPFSPIGNVSEVNVKKCFDFSLSMTFKGDGEHRDHRSGGDWRRNNREIFVNTFQGKLAEFGLFEFISSRNHQCLEPDLDTWERGIWDSFDMDVEGRKINIKSTKHFGNLLLLETKDWNSKGQYIPNNNVGENTYDFIFLVRIKPDVGKIIRLGENKDKRELLSKVLREKWYYDLPGYITHGDLLEIIQHSFVLPKKGMLNGKIQMDAENYYVQTGDLREFDDAMFLDNI